MIHVVKALPNRGKAWLRYSCSRLSPKRRMYFLLVACLLFGSYSLYVFISSIYFIGKKDAQLIEIEHIKQLYIQQHKDSIHSLNFYNHGKR